MTYYIYFQLKYHIPLSPSFPFRFLHIPFPSSSTGSLVKYPISTAGTGGARPSNIIQCQNFTNLVEFSRSIHIHCIYALSGCKCLRFTVSHCTLPNSNCAISAETHILWGLVLFSSKVTHSHSVKANVSCDGVTFPLPRLWLTFALLI